jgi:glucuronate isomerase
LSESATGVRPPRNGGADKTGKHLYETNSKGMSIIDYFCHLKPQKMHKNKNSQTWQVVASTWQLLLTRLHVFGVGEQLI